MAMLMKMVLYIINANMIQMVLYMICYGVVVSQMWCFMSDLGDFQYVNV